MLHEAISFFTDEKKIMACLSVTCGDAGHETHAMRGLIDLDGTPVGEDSIFDLASLTKLFTALTVMRLFGNFRLLFLAAARTRSRASLTAASGRPTISKQGKPFVM